MRPVTRAVRGVHRVPVDWGGLFGRLGAGDRRTVDRAMQRLEIADLAERHLRELSGGQRQLVLMAQGLAQEADVLLLDEPLTGLDLVSRERILEAVARERDAGRTVVLSTHDLDGAEVADHVVLLAGRVVADGPPDLVLIEANLREAYGGRLLAAREALGTDEHLHPLPGRNQVRARITPRRRPAARPLRRRLRLTAALRGAGPGAAAAFRRIRRRGWR